MTDPEARTAWQALADFLAVLGRPAEVVPVDEIEHANIKLSRLTGRLWFGATVAIVVSAAGWGMLVGEQEAQQAQTHDQLRARYNYAWITGLSALWLYAFALLAAFLTHQGLVRTGRWPSAVEPGAAARWRPYAGVFALSAAVSVVGMVSLSFYWSIARYGLDAVTERIGPGLVSALANQSPRALLGAILAMGVLALVDVARAQAAEPRALGRSPRARHSTWILCTVALMMLWSPMARVIEAHVNELLTCRYHAVCADGSAVRTIWDVAREQILDDIRAPLASARAGVIGLAVLLTCRWTLVAASRPPGAGRLARPASERTSDAGPAPAR